jgi:hypothetical protein
MAYKIVEKRVFEVTKDEYIDNKAEALKRLKAALTQFKIKTTKEINERIKTIKRVEDELLSAME